MSQPCWGTMARSYKDAGGMTSPRWIEIKAFQLLQHANRARTRPSPLNSWILLCFCIMCVLLSRKLKLAFGFDFYFFSLTQCTFCHTVCALWVRILLAVWRSLPMTEETRTNIGRMICFAQPFNFQHLIFCPGSLMMNLRGSNVLPEGPGSATSRRACPATSGRLTVVASRSLSLQLSCSTFK